MSFLRIAFGNFYCRLLFFACNFGTFFDMPFDNQYCNDKSGLV